MNDLMLVHTRIWAGNHASQVKYAVNADGIRANWT